MFRNEKNQYCSGVYSFKIDPLMQCNSKIPSRTFVEKDSLLLNCIWQCKKPRIAKVILKEEKCWYWIVFICKDCHSKIPHTGWLKQEMDSLTALGAGSPSSWIKVSIGLVSSLKEVSLRGFKQPPSHCGLTGSSVCACIPLASPPFLTRTPSYRIRVLPLGSLLTLCCAELLSCAPLSATPWTLARQAPRSMGFSRQEYWSGLPCPPPGDCPNTVTRWVTASELRGNQSVRWSSALKSQIWLVWEPWSEDASALAAIPARTTQVRTTAEDEVSARGWAGRPQTLLGPPDSSWGGRATEHPERLREQVCDRKAF